MLVRYRPVVLSICSGVNGTLSDSPAVSARPEPREPRLCAYSQFASVVFSEP
jgi:hypothetical protein